MELDRSSHLSIVQVIGLLPGRLVHRQVFLVRIFVRPLLRYFRFLGPEVAPLTFALKRWHFVLLVLVVRKFVLALPGKFWTETRPLHPSHAPPSPQKMPH